MPVLTRAQIQQVKDLPTETVTVPEWGGDVIVRGMNVEELQKYLAMMRGTQDVNLQDLDMTKVDVANSLVTITLYCVVDEDGNRLFTEQDADWLKTKGAGPLRKISEVAGRLTGIGNDAQETIAKN